MRVKALRSFRHGIRTIHPGYELDTTMEPFKNLRVDQMVRDGLVEKIIPVGPRTAPAEFPHGSRTPSGEPPEEPKGEGEEKTGRLRGKGKK